VSGFVCLPEAEVDKNCAFSVDKMVISHSSLTAENYDKIFQHITHAN
jgi:hypothetical protein